MSSSFFAQAAAWLKPSSAMQEEVELVPTPGNMLAEAEMKLFFGSTSALCTLLFQTHLLAEPPPPTYETNTRIVEPTAPPAEENPASAPSQTPANPGDANKKLPFPAALAEGDWLSTFGAHMSLGLHFGGEELFELEYDDGSKSTLRAGEGVSFTGGITWMPLWLGDRLGLGLGLEGGWKFKSTGSYSDGSVEMQRFPLGAAARALVGLGGSWNILVAGGLVYELSPKTEGIGVLTGATDASFDNALGGMVEAGILLGRPNGFGFDVAFRYTAISYDYLDLELSGNNAALILRAHYFL